MQQRKSAAGRPSGTDGSDFSYRMLVDPRYTKVAQGKSRLRLLLIAQAVSLAIGTLWIILSALPAKGFNNLPVVLVIIGLISLITGYLGQKWSNVNLLRIYMVASTMSSVLSIACNITSDLSFKVLQDQSASVLKKFEVVAAGHVLLTLPLQIIVIIVTVCLIQNMSPKRTS